MKPSRSLLLLALLALLLAGCSQEARRDRVLETADAHYQAQEYDKAEVEFLNVLKIDPLNARAIRQLGLIYAEQGRVGPAVAYIRKGNELLPDDLDLRLKLGQINLATGRTAEARAEAEFILERRPNDPEAPLLLVGTAAKSEDVEVIRARLDRLPPELAKTAPVLTARGMLELRSGKRDEAEALYREAIAADPKYAEAVAALGALKLIQRDPAAAEAAFQQAADLSPLRSSRRLVLARYRISQGDAAGGRQLLEDLTAKAPDYIPASLALADLALADRKFDDAAKHIEQALARDPDNIEGRVLRGRLNGTRGQYAKAIEEFQRLASSFPNMPVVHFELGRAYAASGDTANALASLSQAVTIAPAYHEAVLLLANLQIRNRDFSSATIALRRLLLQRPDILPAHLLLADAFRGQGNLDDALVVYRRVDELFPNNTETALPTAAILIQQRKIPEARAALARAGVAQADNPALLEQSVILDLAERKSDDARRRVEEAMGQHPALAGPGHLLLARIAIAQRDLATAEIAAANAVELMPDNSAAYFLLAGIYNASGQGPKALASLKDAAAKNPKDVGALTMVGMLSEQQGDSAAARGAYEKLLEANPRAGIGLNNLAWLYGEKFGELDKGLELALRAREVMPLDPQVADTLGWIHYKKGQYARALGLLQEAASKRSDSAEVQYHLGITQYMMGDEAAARQTLERATADGASYAALDRAKRALALLGTDASARPAIEAALREQANDPVALRRLASLQESEGKLDDAVKSLETALQAYDRNVAVLAQLARVHAERKDSAKALQYARTARQHAPDDGQVALTLGRLAFELGDYSWAAGLMQEAARKLPPAPDLSLDLARSAYSVGRIADAEAALQSALESRATFLRAAEARELLDWINLASNPADSAKESARIAQALEREPTHVPALMAAGVASEQKGDAAAARTSYEKALARYPDFVPAKVRLAVLGAAQTAFDQKAFDWATQARTVLPTHPELAKALGILTFRRGDHARAISLLRESAGARPDDGAVQLYLGRAQLATGNKAAAKTSIERALELGLSPELTEEARKALGETE